MGFWRDIGEAIGAVKPSDVSMGFGHECFPREHSLCPNCGNYTQGNSCSCGTQNKEREWRENK